MIRARIWLWRTQPQRGLFFFLAVVTLSVLITGCSTAPVYKPAARNAAEAALVRGRFKGFIPSWYKLTLEEVDARKVKVAWWQTDWHTPIPIDPGNHRLTVACQYNTAFSSGHGASELEAWLKAGHAYQLCCERQKDLLTFWVEDSATGLRASEQAAARANFKSMFEPSAGDAVEFSMRLTLMVFSLGLVR